MIFLQLAMEKPIDSSSEEYRNAFIAYSNMQMLNTILASAIDQADEDLIEIVAQDLVSLGKHELIKMKANLLVIGLNLND